MADHHSTAHAGPGPSVLVLLTDSISTRLVRGQLGYLQRCGFDVHLGTAVSPGDRRPSSVDLDRLRAGLDPGVVAHHIPFVRQPSPLRDITSLAGTVGLIRRIRPRLVAASTPKAGLLGMIAAWMCRVPVRVYTVRGFRFETMSGRRRSFYVLVERLAMRLAHHVLFNSTSLLRIAESHGLLPTGRGLVLGSGSGNGIDVGRPIRSAISSTKARASLSLPLDAMIIGFVGRLTADKGVNDLVRIFVDDIVQDRRLEEERVHLVVVGDPEPGDPVDPETWRLLTSHPNIHHLGWLDDPQAVYPAFDLLAFPSYREGLPNVPLEAQLVGVPVVGYAATGTVDAVRHGETGILVATGDRRALADALVDLLIDDERRGDFANRARTWVRTTFDREALWSELAGAYRSWLTQP